MARIWWGREFAAAACARDCQMHVARLRPETGCGVPYQYRINYEPVSVRETASQMCTSTYPAVLDRFFMSLFVGVVESCETRHRQSRTHPYADVDYEHLRPPSLPSRRLLLKATQYHSRSSSSGSSSSSQLNASW